MKHRTTPTGKDRTAVLDEYARLATEYESRWSFYVRATSRETLARLGVEPGDSVLDVGCGTGALLSRLATSCPRASLAGVDPSVEMLGMARQSLPATVELKQGWAEEIPYSDNVFDTVVCCNVFHYIRQPDAALKEMFRVLRPHGTLVITDWCDDYLACRICDWYLRLFNAAHFRTYRVRHCRKMLDRIGAQAITVQRYKISWLWGLMTAMSRKPTEAGAQDVEPFTDSP